MKLDQIDSTESGAHQATMVDLESATVRFCGDSGDGMQLAGTPADQHLGPGRQRRGHVSRLSGRDPRPARHQGRGERFPDPLRPPQDLHARRPGRRPGGDESGGPGRPIWPTWCRGGVLIVNSDAFAQARPGPGRLQDQSVGRRHARRLSALPGRHDAAHPAGGRGSRPGHQGSRSLPQLLRHGAVVLALRPLAGTHEAVHHREVRQAPGDRRGQPPGPARGLQLRRDHRGLHQPLPRRPRRPAAGHVSQHHRQPGPGLGADHGRTAERLRIVLRQLSHHAGQRHPARAGQAEEFRRAHLPGRRRDRRRDVGDRRRRSAARWASPAPAGRAWR